MKSASEVRVTMGETGYLSEKTVADYSNRIIWPQIEAAARAGRYGVMLI